MAWSLAYKIWIESLDEKVKWLKKDWSSKITM
jgi:hypothetical protein